MRILAGLIICLFTFSGVAFGDMRVSIVKATGKLIESQSGGKTHPTIDDSAYAQANLDVLTQNAIEQGYKVEDIEVKFISDAEWVIINNALNTPTAEQLSLAQKEDLIKEKMRQQAIDALIAEGELTEAGDLVK
jgi:hypothetical protein